jgi:hypothetical protein
LRRVAALRAAGFDFADDVLAAGLAALERFEALGFGFDDGVLDAGAAFFTAGALPPAGFLAGAGLGEAVALAAVVFAAAPRAKAFRVAGVPASTLTAGRWSETGGSVSVSSRK